MRDPDVVARAPGRVNLIGEHTDYNGGYVLPIAIPQETEVSLWRRDDGRVEAATTVEGASPIAYALGEERPRGDWGDYVRGVTRMLADDGQQLAGCTLRISSRVPAGAGLSSSAALEIALLRALRETFALPLDDTRLALLAQAVENRFVGAPVGVMDPMACSLASAHAALFLDTRSLAIERVPIPSDVELVVIDSGIKHSHATGDYRTRRAECEAAARGLGVRELRDVDPPALARLDTLPDVLRRRARHVITENARVLDAVAALRAGDLPALGRLFDASHASMRDDFEVSVPDIDRLVMMTRERPEVLGARLTGGGFGGSIVALCQAGAGARVGAAVLEVFARRQPRARVLVPDAAHA